MLSTVNHLVQTSSIRVSALVYFQYSNIKAAKGVKVLPSSICGSVGLSMYFSKKGCLCLILNVLLCFLGTEEISSDKCLWQNRVRVQFVTKTLQYDEFNPAASCGKIPSGFTLR